jgi:hypothetical protein
MGRVWLAIALLTMTGCAPSADDVRTVFAHEETCPLARVHVAEEEGRHSASNLAMRESPPPPDVEADPQRLGMWKAEHADAWSHRGDIRVYRISGCGTEEEVACYVGFGLSRRCRTLSTQHDPTAEDARKPTAVDELLEKQELQAAQTRELLCGPNGVERYSSWCARQP